MHEYVPLVVPHLRPTEVTVFSYRTNVRHQLHACVFTVHKRVSCKKIMFVRTRGQQALNKFI